MKGARELREETAQINNRTNKGRDTGTKRTKI